ncbi:MAG: CBS domain-containing protein, partial [Syntrophales bacterium LBB04]|nr:CBS domain-containing protein [Syntrophales bacterium LBB04]
KATHESIMDTRVVSTTLDAPKSDVVDLFVKYGLRALPVVDEEGCIRGVIRFKVLLEVIAPGLRR